MLSTALMCYHRVFFLQKITFANLNSCENRNFPAACCHKQTLRMSRKIELNCSCVQNDNLFSGKTHESVRENPSGIIVKVLSFYFINFWLNSYFRQYNKPTTVGTMAGVRLVINSLKQLAIIKLYWQRQMPTLSHFTTLICQQMSPESKFNKS